LPIHELEADIGQIERFGGVRQVNGRVVHCGGFGRFYLCWSLLNVKRCENNEDADGGVV
jgi:hypothetical protein